MSISKNKVFSFLIEDLFLPRKKKFMIALSLIMTGMASQFAAYGILYRYVNALEKAQPIEWKGLSIDPATSLGLLTVIAILVCLFIFLSSYLDYKANTSLFKLSHQYNVHCAKTILQVHQGFWDSNIDHKLRSVPDQKKVRRAIAKDSKYCARAARVVLFAVKSTVILFVSLMFMFSIHGPLSLIILSALIPLAFSLKNQSKKIARMTKSREDLISKFISETRTVLSGHIGGKMNHDDKLEETAKFFDIFYAIRKESKFMSVIIAGFLAAILCIIVFTAGNLVLFGGMPWSVFIAYVLALRFFLTSVQGLNGIAKNGSNIYHYVNHYLIVLNALKAGKGESVFVKVESGALKEDYSLHLEESDDDEDDDSEF